MRAHGLAAGYAPGVATDKQYIHIVWSPATGPIMAYYSPDRAHDHGRSMLGVQVTPCEVREELPDVLRDDVYIAELEDFDDDETPVEPLPPPPSGPIRRP